MTTASEKMQAAAWLRIAEHPFFADCYETNGPLIDAFIRRLDEVHDWLTAIEQGASEPRLPIHRTEAGWPNCATCDGGGCHDCTELG